MKRLVVLVVALVLASVAESAAATTYVIKPDGSGDFPTIQAAILAVGDGDVLELADGTFTGDGNRDLDYLGKAIAIRSQSGNPDACIIDCGGILDNPHRGFHFHSGETSASVLEGVTIRGGFSQPEAGFPSCCGAGILCTDGSSPTISNCVLTANEAGGTGGGMFCYQSSPTVSGSTFSDNRAQSGGALVCWDGANPTLTACMFSGNETGGAGGAIACALASPTLIECVFSTNSTEKSGGALWCAETSNPILTACTFSENMAGDTWSGGAIHCEGASSPEIDGCIFSDNFAGYGGAIGCETLASLLVTNCTFSGNTAVRGSGLFVFDSAALTMNNTIVAYGIQGEAVACFGTGAASLSCCDLFDNAGGDWVGCIEPQLGVEGNFSEDPLFCDLNDGNLYLRGNSPCAAEHNPACGLVGARPVSCATPTHPTTWGRLKAQWR